MERMTPAAIPPTTAETATAIETGPQVVDTVINTGESLQEAVDAHPGGTEFTIGAGVHRLASVVPKQGDSFVGESGAVLSGAAIVDGWTKEGNHWLAAGQETPAEKSVKYEGRACLDETSAGLGSGPGACRYPHILFFDDQPLTPVFSHEELVSGTFFFDEANDEIWLADDPTSRKVELSITELAFDGLHRNNVTIRNLTIEKYATGLQTAAVQGGESWTVSDCTVRFNHGFGIKVGSGSVVSGCRVHHQGQGGVKVVNGAVGVVYEGNEIDHNGRGGINPLWEGGGSKFVESVDLVVRNNNVHDNYGPGLWTDFDNRNTLYEGNTIVNNQGAGIIHEISHQAVIRDNTIEANGYKMLLGGIYISNSAGVEVYGNTLKNNKVGVLARQADRGVAVQDLYVHDNIVIKTSGEGYAMGLIVEDGGDSYFTSKGNVFESNSYTLGSAYTRPFHWQGGLRRIEAWKSYGNDTNGTVVGG